MEHRNQPKNFSEIKIGDKAGFEVEIDEDLHRAFSKLIKDYSPVHWDEEYYSKTQFKDKIGYAFLLTGFLSRFYGEYLPGGSSICIKQEAKFIKPYFVGDTIRVEGEVINKISSTNFVDIMTKIYRSNDECVFKGMGTVQILPVELGCSLNEDADKINQIKKTKGTKIMKSMESVEKKKK